MKTKLCAGALALCASWSAAAPCSVPWKDSHGAASSRAFNFEIRRSEGKGACFAHGLAFMASAASDSAVTCEVTFFSGAAVREGWNITVVSDTGGFERVAASAPTAPPVLRIKAAAGETMRFVPRTIEVSGPGSCAQWLEALTPAQGG